MFRSSGILLLVCAFVSVTPLRSGAQNKSETDRILRPLGNPTSPIRLKAPSTSAPFQISPVEAARPLAALPITASINFHDFMQQVEEDNLALAAQRYNVPIAQAQLKAAAVYPNPMFQAGYGGDVSNERQATTYSGSLSEEVVLGGKIGDREKAARAALEESRASLSDYLRALRGQAADAFIDGLAGILKLRRDVKSLQRAHQLVELNVERVRSGDTSQDSVMRSRISELETHSNLADAQSSLHQALAYLTLLMGKSRIDGLIAPAGDLESPARSFPLEGMVRQAVSTRSDVLAAEYAFQSARANYQLTLASRIPDITIAGNYAHLTRITNPIDTAPAWDSLGVSFSVPIPFSNFNGGAVQTAYYQQLQAQKSLQAARLQAEIDVRTAYEQYTLAAEEAELFATELVNDSDQAYKLRLFKLEKGQVTLTDVLDAHAALDQLYLDYYNALRGRAKALVALEQAAGIWDVNF
ncbi:MAG: TolC family protein [Candidatus Binataceae bacterium]|jgi:cobalt-zinc-cadmium efflux system outer membrane protein